MYNIRARHVYNKPNLSYQLMKAVELRQRKYTAIKFVSDKKELFDKFRELIAKAAFNHISDKLESVYIIVNELFWWWQEFY